MNAWGIDVFLPQWPFLKGRLNSFRQGGMTFIVWKGTMGLGNSGKAFLDEINQEALEAGLIRGIYGWIDPIYPLTDQLERFEELIDVYDPDFVAGDYEHWWADWQEYFDYLNGKIPSSKVRVLDPGLVAKFGQAYMKGLTSFGVPTWMYTARWFTDGYVGGINAMAPDALPDVNLERVFAGMGFDPIRIVNTNMLFATNNVAWPGLANNDKLWMADFPVWDAAYWNGNRDRIVFYDYAKLDAFMGSIPNVGVSMPYWTERMLWQWSSVIVLPGVQQICRTDMDFWNGSEEEMREALNVDAPGPDPEPVPEPVYPTKMTMLQGGTRIRWKPGTSSSIVSSPVDMGQVVDLAPMEAIEADGYVWEPVVVWVARGPVIGTQFGKLS